MASIYQGDRSPIWWIKFHGLAGKIRSESTGCRIDIRSETAKARQLEAKRAQVEADAARVSNKEYFDRSVGTFLATRDRAPS